MTRDRNGQHEQISGPHCETCGRSTLVACGICGTCAEDWNARDVEAGTRAINRRRKAHGLEPITRD